MRRKKVILLIVLSLILILTSICSAEKPLGEITNANDVINKVFTGRSLDPIEGIWIRDEERGIVIVKSSVLYPNQIPPKYDYTVIKFSGKLQDIGGVWEGLKRTSYNFSFKGHVAYWKLLSPDLLEDGVWKTGPYTFPSETYVRTYPTH
jgi:hypothetical protein